jgi:hypothetical protein
MPEPGMSAPNIAEVHEVKQKPKFHGLHDYQSKYLRVVDFELKRNPDVLQYLRDNPLPNAGEYLTQIEPDHLNNEHGTLSKAVEYDIQKQSERVVAIDEAIFNLNRSETVEEAKERYVVLKELF